MERRRRHGREVQLVEERKPEREEREKMQREKWEQQLLFGSFSLPSPSPSSPPLLPSVRPSTHRSAWVHPELEVSSRLGEFWAQLIKKSVMWCISRVPSGWLPLTCPPMCGPFRKNKSSSKMHTKSEKVVGQKALEQQ